MNTFVTKTSKELASHKTLARIYPRLCSQWIRLMSQQYNQEDRNYIGYQILSKEVEKLDKFVEKSIQNGWKE